MNKATELHDSSTNSICINCKVAPCDILTLTDHGYSVGIMLTLGGRDAIIVRDAVAKASFMKWNFAQQAATANVGQKLVFGFGTTLKASSGGLILVLNSANLKEPTIITLDDASAGRLVDFCKNMAPAPMLDGIEEPTFGLYIFQGGLEHENQS